MKRIAIDMDEVMADTIGHCLNLYKNDFDIALTKEEIQGRKLWDIVANEHRQHVRGYFDQEEFFANINVMPGSQQVVRDLAEEYEVFVATAAMDVPCSFSAKFHWLAKHFPFIPPSRIVFCGDKSIIAADYLIDDNVRQLDSFTGEGIIFSAPHNMAESRFRRVDSWEDVGALFLSAAVQTRRS